MNVKDKSINILSEKIKIAEIVKILPPIDFNQNKDDFCFQNSGIPYLTYNNIRNGKFIWNEINQYIDVSNVCVKDEFADKYLSRMLKTGDILIPSLKDLDNIYMVQEDDLPAIAGQYMTVLRPTAVDAKVFFNYLCSDECKKIIYESLEKIYKDDAYAYDNIEYFSNIRLPYINLLSKIELDNIYKTNILKIVNYTSDFIKNKEKINNFDFDCNFNSNFEQKVYDLFIQNGWNTNEVFFSQNEKYFIGENKYIPDFILKNNNKDIAVIELKLPRTLEKIKKYRNIIDLINTKYNVLFILSTGEYFEVYKNKDIKPLKLFRVPSKNELLAYMKDTQDLNDEK